MKNQLKKKSFDFYPMIRISAAIGIALFIAMILIFCVGDDPVTAIVKFATGPFTTKRNFFNVIEGMIPLVFTGLAMCVIYRSGYFNMGADGSLYMGAVIAAYIAIKLPMGFGVNQVVILLASGTAGGLICMLPVIIRKYTNANVTVLSIMFNSIFFYVGVSIVSYYLLEPGQWRSYTFPDDARFGSMISGTSMHYGVVIAFFIWIGIVVLLNKTSFGYKLKATGENKAFAKASGLKTARIIMTAQFIGGALAGVGGAIEMVGLNSRFSWSSPVNYLWDGILVNLLAGSRPELIPLAAFGLSYLRIGASIMSRSTNIDNEIVAIVQGIIILLVASERFLYHIKRKREQKEALIQVDQANGGA